MQSNAGRVRKAPPPGSFHTLAPKPDGTGRVVSFWSVARQDGDRLAVPANYRRTRCVLDCTATAQSIPWHCRSREALMAETLRLTGCDLTRDDVVAVARLRRPLEERLAPEAEAA